jgi:hypothetical protein
VSLDLRAGTGKEIASDVSAGLRRRGLDDRANQPGGELYAVARGRIWHARAHLEIKALQNVLDLAGRPSAMVGGMAGPPRASNGANSLLVRCQDAARLRRSASTLGTAAKRGRTTTSTNGGSARSLQREG